MAGCFLLAASPLKAEPPLPMRGLPPLSAATLNPNSFDVRSFDPFGMILPTPQRQRAPVFQSGPSTVLDVPVMEAMDERPAGFFSDQWSRTGFARQP